MPDEDFQKALEEWKNERTKPRPPVSSPPKVRMEVQLTKNQKRVLLDYLLGGVGKGVFEDCPEFWQGMEESQIDELYGAYRDASDKFVDEVREYVIRHLI